MAVIYRIKSFCGWLCLLGFFWFLSGAHSYAFMLWMVWVPFLGWLLLGTPLRAIVLGILAGLKT